MRATEADRSVGWLPGGDGARAKAGAVGHKGGTSCRCVEPSGPGPRTLDVGCRSLR